MILDKFEAGYWECTTCGYLQTDEPHWLDEAYGRSINASDTGLVERNLVLSRFASSLFGTLFDRGGKYLDYAGGWGLFVRIMRDIGFDFYWADKYSDNLMACGFEGKTKDAWYEAVTAFEVFEHFVDPADELLKLSALSDTILLSTELYGDSPPNPMDWDYYGLSHGQHIGFFGLRTLRYIAATGGWRLWTNGRNIHLLTKRSLPGPLVGLVEILGRLGLARMTRMTMRSRTYSDWDRLR